MVYTLGMNPGEIMTKEIPRMELVNKKFVASVMQKLVY